MRDNRGEFGCMSREILYRFGQTDTAAGAARGGIALKPEIDRPCALGARDTSIGWNSSLTVLDTALIIRSGRGSNPVSRMLATGRLIGLSGFSPSFPSQYYQDVNGEPSLSEDDIVRAGDDYARRCFNHAVIQSHLA